MTCPVCGTVHHRRGRARYCSPECYAATRSRSRKSTPLWVNTRAEQPTTPTRHKQSIGLASVQEEVRAAALKPTPAQIVAALARIGREMGR